MPPVPNSHTCALICAATSSEMAITLTCAHTKLDSHTNMVVLGAQSYVFKPMGQICNVKPFTTKLGKVSNVPIVDGALAYNCPYTKQTHVLLACNVLYIPTMSNNLISPFIMRAGGVQINDVPKIHSNDLSEDYHCITFLNREL